MVDLTAGQQDALASAARNSINTGAERLLAGFTDGLDTFEEHVQVGDR